MFYEIHFLTSFAILLALVASVRRRSWPRGAGEEAVEAEAEEAGEAKGEVIRAVGSRASDSMGPPARGPNTRRARIQAGTRDAGTNANPLVRASRSTRNPRSDPAPRQTDESWRLRSDNGAGGTGLRRTAGCGITMTANGWTIEGPIPTPPNPYVVARPVVADPVPEATFSGGPITITNPATNKETLSYTLNGIAYTILPGYSQDFRADRAWAIQFSRGENLTRPVTGSSRAYTRLPVRTTGGNCTAPSRHERKER